MNNELVKRNQEYNLIYNCIKKINTSNKSDEGNEWPVLKNLKTLMKKIEGDTNKWKHCRFFVIFL